MGRHKGYKHTEETKRKCGRVNKGRKHTAEHIVKRMEGAKKSWFKKGEKCKNWNGLKKGIEHPCFTGGNSTFSKHHQVWLEHNQLPRVPYGCVIHHRNMNHNNNDIDNLLLLTQEIHREMHAAHKSGKI